MTAVETAVGDYPDYDLVVVGHSLGGAIATFAATQLRNSGYAASLVGLIFDSFFISLKKGHFNLVVVEYNFGHCKC